MMKTTGTPETSNESTMIRVVLFIISLRCRTESGSLPRPVRRCLPGRGGNLQQQVWTHHSSAVGAEPHLRVAPVPFFDAGLLDFERFELQQQWVLLRLGRRAVDESNRFGFTGGAGLARVGLALRFAARLFG